MISGIFSSGKMRLKAGSEQHRHKDIGRYIGIRDEAGRTNYCHLIRSGAHTREAEAS